MAEKLFYSMGEVAEMFDVKPSLIRHWETRFSVLRPKRNKKGNRLFTPADVEHLKLIYHLVKEQGMTLEGAEKALRSRRKKPGAARDLELLERLQRVRALLEEVRTQLRDDGGSGAKKEVRVGDAFVAAGAELGSESFGGEETGSGDGSSSAGKNTGTIAAPVRRGRKAVVKITEADSTVESPTGEEAPAGAAGGTAGKKGRRPRRRKDDGEPQELFAFYEQSLF